MKRTLSSIALFVAATFITVGAWAQDATVKATIPFNFTVNNNSVPAGSYTITSSTSPNLLEMSNRQGHVHILTNALPAWNDRAKTNVMVFHKYGDQYYLSAIRSESNAMNLYFPPTKAEKRAQTQTQVAALPASGDVVVALY